MAGELSFFAVSAEQAPPLLVGYRQNNTLLARQQAQNLH